MIITAKSNGDVLNIKPEVFYQGSTENRIWLIAPFAINSSVSIWFELPNTEKIPAVLMTPSSEISDTLNTWVYKVNSVAITQRIGLVKVNVSITTPNGQVISLKRCQFEVKKGNNIELPATPTQNVYEQIVQALADIYGKFINSKNMNILTFLKAEL